MKNTFSSRKQRLGQIFSVGQRDLNNLPKVIMEFPSLTLTHSRTRTRTHARGDYEVFTVKCHR